MDVGVSRTWDEWWIEALKERNKALEALAESRARFGDSEARRAELEALIEKVRELHDLMPGSEYRLSLGMVLASSPSVVLADRDREVAARALEDAADRWVADDCNLYAADRLRERAAAIRKGDTNA